MCYGKRTALSILIVVAISCSFSTGAVLPPRKAGGIGDGRSYSQPGRFSETHLHYSGGFARRRLTAALTGFDVVVVAGQSNGAWLKRSNPRECSHSPPLLSFSFPSSSLCLSTAVGNSFTPDPAALQNDATTGLPIFVSQLGVDSANGGSPSWSGPGGVRPRFISCCVRSHRRARSAQVPFQAAQENLYHISSTSGGGINDFSVSFAKNYVAGGFLAPGRGVLIVNTGFFGSGFEFAPTNPYTWPSPGNTTLLLCWAPDASCNPAVATVATATGATMEGPVVLSLFTHATYRIDMALSIDPASGAPPPNGSLAPNAANRVVAVLWHQGAHVVSACDRTHMKMAEF